MHFRTGLKINDPIAAAAIASNLTQAVMTGVQVTTGVCTGPQIGSTGVGERIGAVIAVWQDIYRSIYAGGSEPPSPDGRGRTSPRNPLPRGGDGASQMRDVGD